VFTFLTSTVLVTYTNSRYEDIWPIYFGQLDALLPEMKSYVISDSIPKAFFHHKFLLYKNPDWYWKHWCENLESIPCEYFIYMQEDFFLYERPDLTSMQRYSDFLNVHPELSFVRLNAHSELPKQHIEQDLFSLPAGNPYVFSMQPTIWRKNIFLKLYNEVKSEDFREKQTYIDATVKLNISGVYVYNNEPKRGIFHFDSQVFPYIATGLIRRKWNTVEYPEELTLLTKKYGIDMNIRGYYNPAEAQEW